MCLGIIRTLILERRPVSMVTKAIHVLITSYSHSTKTNPHLRGTKSDKTQASGAQHAVSSMSGADVSAADALGKSVILESAARVDSGYVDKSSTVLGLDSDGEATSANQRRNTSESQAHSAHVTQSSLQSGQEETQLSSPAISPDEMYSFVFAPVDEEMVGDPSYLVTIIVEFLHRYATT